MCLSSEMAFVSKFGLVSEHICYKNLFSVFISVIKNFKNVVYLLLWSAQSLYKTCNSAHSFESHFSRVIQKHVCLIF